MAKSSVKQFYTSESFQALLTEVESSRHAKAEKKRLLEAKFIEEIERVKDRFLEYEKEFMQDYLRLVDEHHHLTETILTDHNQSFQLIDQKFVDHQKEVNQWIAKENEQYHLVLNAFEDLRKHAKQSYDALCVESDRIIETEIRMHRDFVKAKETEFEQIKQQYSELNNNHYNELLWAMEKSKNALFNIKQDLEKQSFENIKQMNQQALSLLEILRDTKNKITQLFKTTTNKYARRRDEIELLGQERQFPHTVVNQRLIDAYIKQIRVVNEKKTELDQRIREDLNQAKLEIGQKILTSEAKQDKYNLERYILQYGIVQTKADYLLKHNQEMADLLIQKYQNEIEKLKIDSFRRREEIKLAYHMPFAFCQASIGLYSNFAFFVNETFDRMDRMLSDFIQSIRDYVDPKYAYLYESSKTFEDYKINVQVLTNTITNQLTELLIEVENLSKEIILLESNNRIEIAEIEKAMEHADITSDYEKYLAELNLDYFLADYQHDLNLKKIKNEANHRSNLITIERTLQTLKKREHLFGVGSSHAKQINKLERDIHDAHFDYELALEELHYRRSLTLLEEDLDGEFDAVEETFIHKVYEISRMVLLKETRLKEMKQQGSRFIIEYVESMQRLLDQLHQDYETSITLYFENPNSKAILHHIYEKRKEALQFLHYRHKQATQRASQAVMFFHRIFYLLETSIHTDLNDYLLPFKHALVQLNPDTAMIFLSHWRHHSYYLRETLHLLWNSFRRIEQTLIFYPHQSTNLRLSRLQTESLNLILPIFIEVQEQTKHKNLRPHHVDQTIRKALIALIEAIPMFEAKLHSLLNDYQVAIMEQDVIYLYTKKKPYLEAKRITTLYYDRLLTELSKALNHKHQIEHQLQKETLAFEQNIKHRVARINHLYLMEVAKEQQMVDYIKKVAWQEIKTAQKAKNDQLHELIQNKSKRRKAIEKHWLLFKQGFETLKINNYEYTELHNRHLDGLLGKELNVLDDMRKDLRKEEIHSPTVVATKALTYEQDKQSLIETKKQELIAQFAKIEEHKYLNRPQYVSQMTDVKNRLQSDYIEKYQSIAKAEKAYLDFQSLQSSRFKEEFQRFTLAQEQHQAIMSNDQTFFSYLDRSFEVMNDINESTKDIFQTTYSKSKQARESIQTTEDASKQNQKRILGV